MSDPAPLYAPAQAGGDDARHAADGDRQRDRSDWPVRAFRMGEEPPDREYWLSRTPSERLAAGEEMRRRYYGAGYDASEGFPRLCRIVYRS